MNKTLRYSLAAVAGLTVVGLVGVGSRPVLAQAVEAIVRLQQGTPGIQQQGHTNISGTSKAGQFVGGGAGLTGVDAAKLGGKTVGDFLPSNVPIVLNVESTSHWFRINNVSTTGNAPAFFGESRSSTGRGITGYASEQTGANFGVRGRSDSGLGTGVYGEAFNGTGVNYGVYGMTNSPNGYGGYFTGGLGLFASKLAVGSTAHVTDLNADLLDGLDSAAFARLGLANTWTGVNTFSNAGNVFTGKGAGLTGLDADNIWTGTLADARLSANVALLSGAQTFTGAKTFSSAVDVDARTTTNNFTMSNGGAANTVLLGAAGGVASWGTVGNARLSNDAASLSKVTGGAWTMDGTTLTNGTGGLIELIDGVIKKMEINANPGASGRVLTYGPNGSLNAALTALGSNTNHGYMQVYDANGAGQVQMYVDSNGNGIVTADTKNFVVADPEDARFDIVYACVEGPEAAMYTRGTGKLVNGQATIQLPDHYLKLANLSTATIQVTPLDDCNGLFVKKMNGTIVVKELGGGKANVEFDWRIEAVRKGKEDYRPVRPWNDALPEGDQQTMWNARLKSLAAKQAASQGRTNRP